MRKMMMVVDSTPECMNALRFAARRAEHIGSTVTMLYVIEPEDFQHWVSVRDVMRAEARREAEERLEVLAREVHELSGVTPEFVIREGNKAEEVLAQIAADSDVHLLVLGASTGPDGPGPLIADLVGKRSGGLSIPVVVVPGGMTPEKIDEIG